MNALKVLNVVGGRPNFIKIAPLMAQMKQCPEICPILVHTGQHYDDAMSDVFFRDLEIPEPDIHLDVGSGSYVRQTTLIMQRFEEVLLDVDPNLVLVAGDVNSTLAASLASVTLGYPVAHVEAGLRSFDREMPEESNRVLTDSGGVQEESTFLEIPCLTLRDSTERPVTVTEGTNQLVETAPEKVIAKGLEIIGGTIPHGHVSEHWDGRASQRIVSVLVENAEKIEQLYHAVRDWSVCLNTLSPVSLQSR